MTGPLVLLSLFVLALGLPALSHRYGVSRWLDAPATARALHVGAGEVLLTTLIALAAIGAVLLLHHRRPDHDPVAVLGPVARPLARAFYVDDVYDVALVRPVRALARGVVRVDSGAVDAAVVDTGRTAGFAGGALRRLQRGNIQSYLTGLVAGVLVVVISVSLAVAR
jgi:NADH-quinone oxidoreductase subunit L